MIPLRTILCPIDLAEPGEPAFQLACSLAREHSGRVLVLYVCPPPCCHGEVVARRQPDGYEEGLWQLLRGYQEPGMQSRVEHRLEEGDAAREILRVAREVAADLIVIGTHGRTGLPRLLLGSVAEQIVGAATCPVLTVKMPCPREEPAPEEQPEAVLKS
jgi:nucleotide-binding universal stress UspA family protein